MWYLPVLSIEHVVFALSGGANRKLSLRLRLSMVEWKSVHPNPKRIILGLAHFNRLGILLPGCGDQSGVDEF